MPSIVPRHRGGEQEIVIGGGYSVESTGLLEGLSLNCFSDAGLLMYLGYEKLRLGTQSSSAYPVDGWMISGLPALVLT